MGLVSLLVLIMATAVAGPVLAEEVRVHVSYLGLHCPSSFAAQLHVRVTNESFTSFPLIDKMKTSELLIDGQVYKRKEVPFEGPVGLGAKGSWEGCLHWEDYAPPDLPAGSHRLQWRLADSHSEEIRVKMEPPEPVATTDSERLRQTEALKAVLVPGLLQSCVGNWLTERDGGMSSTDEVRYYVAPGVKVVVPYDRAGPEPRIKGPLRLYLEGQIAD